MYITIDMCDTTVAVIAIAAMVVSVCYFYYNSLK